MGRTEKAKMYREVMAIMDELKEVVDSTDKKFLYAENFVYALRSRRPLRSSAPRRARCCS